MSKCTPPNNEALLEEQQRVRDFHTTKVLEAAREGIGLFTLPGPCIAHSPLLICGVSLTLLAEISACRSQLHGDRHAAGRERVRLGLGVLKAYGKVLQCEETKKQSVDDARKKKCSLVQGGCNDVAISGRMGRS